MVKKELKKIFPQTVIVKDRVRAVAVTIQKLNGNLRMKFDLKKYIKT